MFRLHLGNCLIDEGQSFLLTGGYYSLETLETVSRYNINGWLEDLGDLNTGRRLHGCTRYTNNQGCYFIRIILIKSSPVEKIG